MKMKSIYVFVKLAESNCDFNVHKMLGIPRSSMWSYISDLEKTLGKKLINRKKQSLSFTAAGEEFIPYAHKIYQTYEESLVNTQNAEDSTIGGDIFISTTTAIAPQWSMGGIKKLYAKFPNLRLHITASDEITRDEENASDVLIRPFGDSENFRKVWCINYHHGLFASQDYLNKRGIPEVPEDLLSHSVIGYGEHSFSYYDEINWHLKGQGYGLPKLKPALTINSTKAIYDAAKNDLGICSSPIESNKIYSGNLIRVLPQIVGPNIKTYFCVKKSAIGRKLRGILTFNTYFETYLKQIGIEVSPLEEIN
ncbi:MAG TPA: LysR family transcriptional regulator [Alphaproteobacteria bacterium]|nr:LysR family transcriptional regulator [Alphaproteobacteria bacterium]